MAEQRPGRLHGGAERAEEVVFIEQQRARERGPGPAGGPAPRRPPLCARSAEAASCGGSSSERADGSKPDSPSCSAARRVDSARSRTSPPRDQVASGSRAGAAGSGSRRLLGGRRGRALRRRGLGGGDAGARPRGHGEGSFRLWNPRGAATRPDQGHRQQQLDADPPCGGPGAPTGDGSGLDVHLPSGHS